MSSLRIEHVNLSVSDADRAARLMQSIFGWQIRWQGIGRDDGRVIHVGTSDHYLALYTTIAGRGPFNFEKGQPLNHVGVEVDDLEATEKRVVEAGFVPFAHGDYDPGRRFYFFDGDGIEFEVISYG